MNADDPYLRSSLRQPMPEPDRRQYSEFEINDAIMEELAVIYYEQQPEPHEPINRPLPRWIASREHLTRPRRYF